MHCWNQTQVEHCNNVPDSWKLINWFFCACKKWVEAQMSLSQSSWFMPNLACSRRLWRWLSFSRMLPSLILKVFSKSRNKSFICALLCDARRSSASINDETRWCGSELQRKIGSFTRFEEMETEVGIRFPIHFIVLVSLKPHSCTQIDSTSNIAKFLKSVCS